MSVVSRLMKYLALSTILFSSAVWADRTYNMSPGVTQVSRDIYFLHMTIIWICVAIGVVVFGVMFYAIIMHRKSRGAVAANFHESTKIEVLWTIIPFIILISMAIPATNVLRNMYDTEDSDLSIKVTGYMWRWQYDYLGEGVSFMSNLSTPYEQINNRDVKGEHYLWEVDNPVVVPINKKIRFLTTSNDVIHSWWVREIGVKKDAIPGFINEAWAVIEEPGIYRGQCAELCGARHGYMPIVVDARTEEDYQAWLAEQKAKSS